MTKKIKISLLILVWCIVAIQIYVNHQEKMKHGKEIVTAFSIEENGSRAEEAVQNSVKNVDTDAFYNGEAFDFLKKKDSFADIMVGKEKVTGYGYFGTMELSEEMKEKMLINLVKKLGIMDGYTLQNGRGSGFEKKILSKNGQYANTTIQIISMETEKKHGMEQYIVFEIEAEDEVSKAISIYRRVKEIYAELGMDGQVGLEISMEEPASANKNVEKTDLGNMVDEILKLTEAKKIDEINENGICTMYAYTPLNDSYLKLNGKKVNLQIVLTYDEEAKRTYCKIGVPIVNTSY